MPQFSKAQRLLKKAQFDSVLNNGIKVVCRDFVLVASAAGNGQNPCRLGLIVSKKVGESVARNRIKRCVRESFRNQNPSMLIGRDLVVIARPTLTAHKEKRVNLDVQSSFQRCLDRLSQGVQKASKNA